MNKAEWQKNGYKYILAFELGMWFMALLVGLSKWL